MQAREGSEVCNVLRKQNHRVKILHLAILSFKTEEDIKTLSDTNVEGIVFW